MLHKIESLIFTFYIENHSGRFLIPEVNIERKLWSVNTKSLPK